MRLRSLPVALLFLFYTLECFSQVAADHYSIQWARIDSLLHKANLPLDAMKLVQTVQKKAIAEKKSAEQLRCLLYKIQIREMREEDAYLENIMLLEKMPLAGDTILRSVQQFYLGLLYLYYFNESGSVGPRTIQSDNDISTWSAADFHKKIRSLFLSSLQYGDLLQNTPLHKWQALLQIEPSGRPLRPTLYDLLANEVLDYLESVIDDRTQVPSSFTLSSPTYMDDADIFCKIRLPESDSTSALCIAIRIFQNLLSLHKKQNNLTARGDIDLLRIQFVYTYANFLKKDSLYLSAIDRIIQSCEKGSVADEARCMKAEWYIANSSRSGAPVGAYLATAKRICEETVQLNDSTIGTKNCRFLLEGLNEKKLYFLAEEVNLPEEPFRLLVTYKNTDRIHLRLFRLENREALALRNVSYYQETFWDDLVNRTPLRQWAETLPDGYDLQEHKTELKMEALPLGSYLILASFDSGFTTKGNQLSLQVTRVSSIGWIQLEDHIYIVDRGTGLPKPNARVHVWTTHVRDESGTPVLKHIEQLMSDSNGRVEWNETEAPGFRYLIEIEHGADYLFMEKELRSPIVYNLPEVKEKKIEGFLYTDRSIYRPQQEVFFKGIVTSQWGDEARQPETYYNVAVYLKDPSGRSIDSTFLTTNSFGSYAGSFHLPNNQMTGTYTLWDTKSFTQASFQVEAYKRPRFEVVFTPPTEYFRLEDTIRIQGKAHSFSGGSISNAKVTYTIKRKGFFGPFMAQYRPGFKRVTSMNQEQLIATGTTVTNGEGDFLIRFKAHGGLNTAEDPEGIRDFEVQADITDIQGETQSGNWSIPIGSKSMRLVIDAPDVIDMNELTACRVFTQNLYGTHVPRSLHVQIIKLSPPDSKIRKRFWERPDRFKYSEKEFKKWFPLDEYASESDPASWKEDVEILNKMDSSRSSGALQWHSYNLAAGWYKLTVQCLDDNENRYTATKRLRIRDKVEMPGPLLETSILIQKKSVEPGDTVDYRIHSNMDSIWSISAISGTDRFLEKTSRITPNSQVEKIPVYETDRGGFNLIVGFYRYNRLYTDYKYIAVPFTNKELTIHYSTFREQNLPGALETWRIRIKNNRNLPVKAELLSTLYDASLDALNPHNWYTPSFWIKSPPLRVLICDQSLPIFPLYKDFTSRQWYYTNKKYEKFIPIFNNGSTEELFVRSYGMEANAMRMPNTIEIRGKVSVAYEELSPDEQNVRPIEEGIKTKSTPQLVIPLRKDFRETAFFISHAVTDSNGETEIQFRLPDALGRWKWMNLAHSKDLSFGYADTFAITRKPLMTESNPPRFFREGDRIDFPVKISNTTDKELTGQVQLLLVDPESGASVDGWFQNFFPNQYFTVPAGESIAATFTMEIPFRFNKPVIARVVARTDEFSDGEERIIPVLSNRIMVTESLSIPFDGKKDVRIVLEKLKQSGQSTTLHNHSLTIEYTSNPFWYAVQNLPYLSSLPDESTDQTYLRFYANSLAAWLMKNTPGLSGVIQKWIKGDSLQAPSVLERNESITQTLLEETPWVTEAKTSRSLQHKMIRFYTEGNIENELRATVEKLRNEQNEDGSFSWFSKGPANIAITLKILTGLARLKHAGILNGQEKDILKNGLTYLDHWMSETYRRSSVVTANRPDPSIIFYLYLRSFFPANTLHDTLLKTYSHYYGNVKKYRNQYNKQLQAMIALTCNRNGDLLIAKSIVKSLVQNALFSKEMGMYWKEFNTAGYAWDESPIESHTMLMQAFKEILKNDSFQIQLKTWLIRQKQTQHWPTSAATAEACFALLQNPAVLLQDTSCPTIQLGATNLRSSPQEAGTGFTRATLSGEKIVPAMGEITLRFESGKDSLAKMAWGAVHWQYMDEMDKMTATTGPLKIKKTVFIERSSDSGTVLEPVTEGAVIRTGDKVVARLIVQSERNLEFVHLKDMRASTLEPATALSSHQWKQGLYYYQSNRDASMHFYFDRLPRGTHILSYPMYVQHSGTFHNGIASIECLYAPAFNAHSSSLNFHVE